MLRTIALALGFVLAASIAEAACPVVMAGPVDPGNQLANINQNNTALMAQGVCPAGGFVASPRNIHTCGRAAASTTFGTDKTPSVTETYIAEVFVPSNMTITGAAILNGSAVAGNVGIALANSTGAVVASTAAAGVAASGTAAYQRVPFTTPYQAVGPATYYLLMQNNNTSNRFRAQLAPGSCGAAVKTSEVFGTFTTVTPPITFTADLAPVAVLY